MEQVKLLFIVASFELARDGIADYTKALAIACVNNGCSCAILAWHDSHLKDEKVYTIIPTDAIEIFVLRLSACLNEKDREIFGSQFIHSHKPTHTSIQMVCYGYHRRGWIFGLGRRLKGLLPPEVHVQIMFHELWLGMAANHPIKEKIYGVVQFLALQQFFKMLGPSVVHVGNNVYYSKLQLLNWPVNYLPIPSNIPVSRNYLPDIFYSEFGVEKEKRANFLILLFFGSLHPGWNIESFFSRIESISEGRKIIVVSAGSQGYGKQLWDEMQKLESEKIVFKNLGFRTDLEISTLLQLSDAGICTTPLSLIGKSGTAMAMIEHGLPIIVTRDELQFNFTLKKVEEEYKSVFYWENIQSLKDLKRNSFIMDKISEIAELFLKDITNKR